MSLPLVLLAFAVVAAGTAPVILECAVRAGGPPRTVLLVLAAAFAASATATIAAVAVSLHGPWEQAVAWLTGLSPAHVRRDYGPHDAPALDAAALLLIAFLALCLGNAVGREYAGTRRARRVGRVWLDRIAPALPGEAPNRIRLVLHENPTPMSYWSPGRGGADVVVTTGTLRALTCAEREALLFRVRTHLVQRHHWLIWCAALPKLAFPWSRLFSRTAWNMGRLVEMAADDSAARRYGATAAAGALMWGGPATFLLGAPASAGADADVERRIRRLVSPASAVSAVATALGGLAAAGLVAMPALLALGPVLGPG
jgi:hypothetical protein